MIYEASGATVVRFRRFRVWTPEAERQVELVDVNVTITSLIERGDDVLFPVGANPWNAATVSRAPDRMVQMRLDPDHGLRALEALNRPMLRYWWVDGWAENRIGRRTFEPPWTHWYFIGARIEDGVLMCHRTHPPRLIDAGGYVQEVDLGGYRLMQTGPV